LKSASARIDFFDWLGSAGVAAATPSWFAQTVKATADVATIPNM
jgi:hypothetical protein